MTVLSAQSLRRRLEWRTEQRIIVDPLREDAVGPASIDVRIGSRLRVYRHPIMQRQTADKDWRDMLLNGNRCWFLEPGHAYLATTLEHITVPVDLACQLDGRSTQARMFVSLHQQAGWLDPGYSGCPTLEITVTLPVELAPFDPIGQLMFMHLDEPTDRPYVGRYQNDVAPTPARLAVP
jgi:dCTP deaminase